jgi:phosphatidylinositol phospholipase C beta
MFALGTSNLISGQYSVYNSLLYFCVHRTNENEASCDPAVRSLVFEQTKQWSSMMERHKKEEWEMMKSHLQQQEEILKKLMEVSQANQMKQLLAKHER